MFRIAICDDEETSLQINEALTSSIMEEAGIEYQITCFDDMEKMIHAISSEIMVYNVLLSDILAVGMNGIEAAEELRRVGDKIPIIFISSTAEYALDGYRVNALRYLQKPIQVDKLKEALMEAYALTRKSNDCLVFQVGDKLYRIPFNQIMYLESQGRDTIVNTKDEAINVHMKFSDMEILLPEERFLRCHRSYIINLAEAKDLARYRFLTKDGVEIPVSQLQYVDVKKRFMNYKP